VERRDGLQHMHIPSNQTYTSPGEAYIEGDASSASYFLAGAAQAAATCTSFGDAPAAVLVCSLVPDLPRAPIALTRARAQAQPSLEGG